MSDLELKLDEQVQLQQGAKQETKEEEGVINDDRLKGLEGILSGQ